MTNRPTRRDEGGRLPFRRSFLAPGAAIGTSRTASAGSASSAKATVSLAVGGWRATEALNDAGDGDRSREGNQKRHPGLVLESNAADVADG
jgi:hypothetical protein